MCGVVGFLNLNGETAREDILHSMAKALTHRGPDDYGTYTHESFGIGHTRLSILDLTEKGHQPFISDDGQGVIVFNGEIYNFKSLRDQLKNEGVIFHSSCDTEVLLYALHRWGPQKAILKLDGMFAFAYYDRRDHTLWLARDRAGIKPLYWVDRANVKIFASEMKALLRHPDVPCRPDMHALCTQAVFMRLDGEWTPFMDIKSVLPGTLIKISRDGTESFTYFDLLRDMNIDRILENGKKPFAELLAGFESTFRHCVESHLISDAPLATMCSGGLDSSYMTAVASELKPDIVAYVADLSSAGIHEAAKAEIVTNHLGIKLRKIKIDREIYLRNWPAAVYFNDQANYYMQNIVWRLISKAAHDDGFKVLLAGEGSDEAFGGYRWQKRTYDLWRERRFQSAFYVNNKLTRKLAALLKPFVPLDMRALTRHPFFQQPLESSLLNSPAALSSLDGSMRRMRDEQIFNRLERISPPEERAFLARGVNDFYTHLRNTLHSNDKMSMSVSVESRVPFVANDVIDFGYHLNFASKYTYPHQKYIVKKAAEKKLPREIVYATKMGFGIAHSFWQNGSDFLKGGMVADMFKWGSAEERYILEDVKQDTDRLFFLISLEIWARIFLKNESQDELGEKLLRVCSA